MLLGRGFAEQIQNAIVVEGQDSFDMGRHVKPRETCARWWVEDSVLLGMFCMVEMVFSHK